MEGAAEMEVMPNQRTVTLKLTRGEVCKLLILLCGAVTDDPDRRMHCRAIHAKIRAQLEANDQKWRDKQ